MRRGRGLSGLVLAVWLLGAAAGGAHEGHRVVGDEDGDGRWTGRDIQLALDAAGDKAVVFVPPRVFEVEATVRVGSGQTLEGERGRSVLERRGLGGAPLVELEGATGVEVRGLVLRTADLRSERPGQLPNLLRIVSSRGVVVEDCRFRGPHRASIAIDVAEGESPYEQNVDIALRANDAEGGTHGVRLGPPPTDIVGSGATRLRIEDNRLAGSEAAVLWHGLAREGSIRGNVLNSKLDVHALLEGISEMDVVGNRAEGGSFVLRGVGPGRISENRCADMLVSGSRLTIGDNVLTGNERAATLRVERGGSVVVSGNVIVAGRRGIVLRAVDGASVTGNSVRSELAAIRIDGLAGEPSTSVSVTGNSVLTSSVAESAGAIVLSRAEGCVVSGNRTFFTGGSGPGVRILEGAEDALVVGNLSNRQPGRGGTVESDGTAVHQAHNPR